MRLKTRTKFYRVVPVTVGDKELNCLADESGFIYTREEVRELFEQIEGFYSIDEINEQIKHENKRGILEEHMAMAGRKAIFSNEAGKYLVPKAIYDYKEFNPDKRAWSFKCDWCGQKVSSNAHKSYYTLREGGHFSNNNSYERGCSVACVELIWKDTFTQWVLKNGYRDFFEL